MFALHQFKSNYMGDAPTTIGDVLSGNQSVKVQHEITIAPAVIVSVMVGLILIAILKRATR
jgi:hypothetical protein